MVESWPEWGRVVGVLADPSDPAWTGRALLKLIRAAGERRRPAFLLDLAPEASNLTARFGAAGSDGFAEVAAGDATLASIAHRRPEIQAAYLPCGVRTSAEELAGTRALSALADRVREAEGVLLVVLDRSAARAAAEAGWPDGWVVVGDAEAATGGAPLPGDLPEMGRIAARTEEVEGGPSRWRRHRDRGSFPTLKVVGGVAVLAVLAGAWWWYAGRVTGREAGGADAVEAGTAAGTSAAPGGRGAEARPGSAGAGTVGAEPADSGGANDRPPTAGGEASDARELGFSVLIASYASAEDARERVRQLSSRVEGLYFVAPTRVRGEIWHRVYAGSLSDRGAAEALMERLVEAGAKEEVRAWDVRPVRWSYRLPGEFTERAAAASRAEGLRGRGLPAYVLPAGGGEYRVYSGAFESRDAAAVLGERLREAGVEAELVRRTGRSP